jgi:two-component system phosphate regulon sensor histidine kinase PhoR
MLLAGAGFAVLVGLLLSIVIARRLARPLRAMTEVAGAIAGGDLSRRVDASSSDEVGDLGRRFNEMATRLEQEVATIQQDRRELRAILGGMSEGVIAIDDQDRTVVINDAARHLLLIDPETTTGAPLWQTLRQPAVAEALAEAIKQDAIHTAELRLPRDGSELVLQLHASPIRADTGASRGAVLVITDITEREQIETVRRDFIANASHELKTPIASIRGLVETILEDPEMTVDTRTGFLQRVLRQISRLGNLVGEMLALSRLESRGGAPIARRRTDIVGPVRETIDDARPLAAERSVTLEAELPEEALMVTAEPESLRRIAGNLLDNAIKYSGRESRVAVRLRRRGAEVVLEVRDDGPGIPRDRHDRIFERFYRVDEHRSRKLGGTGLGLSIVKHLVQAHEGRIELESAPGEGSTFRVIFEAR